MPVGKRHKMRASLNPFIRIHCGMPSQRTCLEAGVNLPTIQILLGHANLEDHGALPAGLRCERPFDGQSAGWLGIARPHFHPEMTDHRPELADVFRAHHSDFLKRWSKTLSCHQRKALRDIQNCRTAALGGHLHQCDPVRTSCPLI